MDKPVEALDTVREHRQKSRPIFIVINNILPAITASGDVIQRSCVFDAKGASHEVACVVQQCEGGSVSAESMHETRPDPFVLREGGEP